jgi:hypothetical protein
LLPALRSLPAWSGRRPAFSATILDSLAGGHGGRLVDYAGGNGFPQNSRHVIERACRRCRAYGGL